MRVKCATLREIDVTEIEALQAFFSEESREAAAERELWELKDATKRSALFGVFDNDTGKIIATTGLFRYPETSIESLRVSAPDTLASTDPLAYELGGTIVGRKSSGFGMQSVLLAARMASIHYYRAQIIDHTVIAIQRAHVGDRSRRGVKQAGFLEVDDQSRLSDAFFYPCVKDCKNRDTLQRNKVCPKYCYYQATAEDYATQASIFAVTETFRLSRPSRYIASDGVEKTNEFTRLDIANRTKLYDRICEIQRLHTATAR